MHRYLLHFAMAVMSIVLTSQSSAAVMTLKGKVVLPEFSQFVPKGAVIDDVTVSIHCAGVKSVENLPDGWSSEINADGENYTVRIFRTESEAWLAKLGIPDRQAINKALEAISIGLIFRGQWSDCMHDSVKASGKTASDGPTKADFSLSFETDNSYDGDWKLASPSLRP